MEARTDNGRELYDVLAGGLLQLFEQMEQLNRNLAVIAETLEAINARLSYATVLDNND